mgnify:FL=1
MDMLSINAEKKLARLAAVIGKSTQSWKHWSCVRIQIDGTKFAHEYDCILWAQPIIDAYLGDLDGRIYFCGNLDIHVLCKSMSAEMLSLVGLKIAELMAEESGIEVQYDIYDFDLHACTYAQLVLETYSHHVSLPVLSQDLALPSVPSAAYDLPRVLLVEDDPMTRWMVRQILKDECEFATAADGEKTYLMYEAFKPDIVFLDIHLPDTNGFHILEWIMQKHPDACVVMFSGNDNLDNISNALEDGASGFVAKPFMKESLMHYVRSRRAGEGRVHENITHC